jgi:hypothetical protein
LILLCFVLPDSWMLIQVRNFFVVTHFPLMFMMEALRLGESAVSAIFCLLILPQCPQRACARALRPLMFLWLRP